ncbi:S41 family peptidase [Streptomyces sp. SID13031]|uniref:S41 family peptidase n=1 Tax=Streptomyces sp. SID13031 TaxID=2706046 RepID=UPI0013C8D8A1|nr:S41 family peptidase [Streptomyces sp. SID13031]NEA36791.1 S41 family peptidase [Streptomyces sp. SID13031]
MRTEEIPPLIDRLASLVAEYYVFPGVGVEIADRLRKATADGRYDGLVEPSALADRVTADLQEGNQDLHLRLKFHVDEVVDETDPVAEDIAWRQQAELTAGGMARVERLAGNIGLLEIRPLLFDPTHAGAAVTAAMSLLSATDALLIDLRECRGGSPDMVAFVCSHFFDGEPVHLNDLVSPADNTLRQFWTTPHLPGPRFGGAKPIWVLTSRATFSGGEELTYDLQQLGRATIVGERTGGGAHPREGFKLHPHLEATIPIARAQNPISGTNWERVGVVPDVEVAADDAFAEAYGLALDHVLELAADPGRRAVSEEARAARAVLTAG